MMNTGAKVTIKDVARQSGVSIMTVSRAFHDSDRISPATRQRVFAAAKQLKYQPNLGARILRGGNTRSIGILITHPTGNLIVRRISEQLLPDKYVTYIADSLGDPAIMESVLQEFTARRVDGIVMDWREAFRPLVPLIRSLKNVVMYTEEQKIENECDCCFIDSRPALRKAMDYLFAAGRRDVYYLGPKEHSYTNSVQNVMKEFGLDAERRLIDSSAYPVRPIDGNYHDALRDRLQAGLRPQALLVANDLAAAQACRCIQDHHMRVPEDIAVVGNRNRDFSEFSNPPLTTFAQSDVQVAQYIHEMLMNRMNNPGSAIQKYSIETELIIRKSSG